MKTIQDVDIRGKRVLVRVDFNVPLNAAGEITEDSRIRGALPTLQYALDHNAGLIVASHLGRPKGQVVPAMSLRPVAVRLGELLQRPVHIAPDCVGAEVQRLADQLTPGEVLLLENLRFHPEESKNEAGFAKALADLCDVYVNDAFAVSHRANASVEAIAGLAPVAVAGLLLARELDFFRQAFTDPDRPLAAVVGGAKVSGKLAALQNMLNHVNRLLIGGAMANTFLQSQGHALGASLVEPDMLDVARNVLADAAAKGVELVLPVDLVVADRFDAAADTQIVSVDAIPENWMALDVGPATLEKFQGVLAEARTIVWNGPLGAFEMAPFAAGTLALAETLAQSPALTVVGGGDTDAAVHQAGKAEQMSYISTGGGAFLALLEGRTLPAVAALLSAQR